MSNPHNEFEVAKSIHDLLEPLNAERRQRILRWVGESLGFAPSQPAQAQPVNSGANAAPQNPSVPLTASPKLDIKTFVEQKAPRSDQQFAAVVAYYYRFEASDEKQKLTLDTETIQDATRLVGRKRLTNPLATLNNAKNSGYLNSSTAGEFEISTVGENLVAMTLPSNEPEKKKKAKKKTSKKKGTKKTTKKKSK